MGLKVEAKVTELGSSDAQNQMGRRAHVWMVLTLRT